VMPAVEFRIESNIGELVELLGGAPDRIVSEVEADLQDVLDAAFDLTQVRVHVITGQLKASGSVVPVLIDGDEVSGGIEYSAPYASYEMGRGGEHDFLTPAVEMVTSEVEEMIGRIVVGAVDGD